MPPPSDQEEHRVRRTRPAADDATVGAELDIELSAGWAAPSIARERVEAWLRAHRWPPAQIDELVLAVSEAVSNSVEHGYRVPPETVEPRETVDLRIRLTVADDGYRQVEFVVSDRGRWQEPDTAASTRGHGMLIMRSCTDELVVEGTPNGTTVVLRSRPIPPR
ncbi:ATP-binding protein [Pseudonocardia humida]|uniref:ATP-binding protein n=1 Tax=Pseudonocardia humida TaxID=2800819 RepID=A0ABT0ZXD6_9PSEU|nr:ATP-binding protein [Pseudonocardia humida]MCO1655410.1 ATP-binding protein [Pseudonocardia humida]